ncbi:hypothetical protein [Pseudoalteromonas rubra]|uniref:hypothetical protein n=1 Tax=Pseudoalteromonas rubra TaxID=43658 RepID=UPI000F7B9867|nr:hypothetical protein [Pseudoalteromonas rubra]
MQSALKYALLAGTLLSIHAQAGNITELKVDGNTVLFKTSDAKSHPIPECVTADNKAYWAIDLHTLAGQAKYSTLVTAMSAKAQVTVTSAQACLTMVAAEQVQSIAMVQPAQPALPKSGFAGVTFSLDGDFAKSYNLPALLALDKRCDKSFRGSRVMLWDDYRSMHGNYPDKLVKSNVVILDPIEHMSYSRHPANGSTVRITRKIIFKNGQHSEEYPVHTEAPFCNNFSSTNASYFFYTLNYHHIRKQSCKVSLQLACVY